MKRHGFLKKATALSLASLLASSCGWTPFSPKPGATTPKPAGDPAAAPPTHTPATATAKRRLSATNSQLASSTWAGLLGKQAGDRILKMAKLDRQIAVDSIASTGTDATLHMTFAFRSPTGWQYMSGPNSGIYSGMGEFALRHKFATDGVPTPPLPAGATTGWTFRRGGAYGFGQIVLPQDNGVGQYHVNPNCATDDCCPFMNASAVAFYTANPGNRRFHLHDLATALPSDVDGHSPENQEVQGCASESGTYRFSVSPFRWYSGDGIGEPVVIDLESHYYTLWASSTKSQRQTGGDIFWLEKFGDFGIIRTPDATIAALNGLDDDGLTDFGLPANTPVGPAAAGGMDQTFDWKYALSPPGPNAPVIYEDSDMTWKQGTGAPAGDGKLELVDLQLGSTSFKPADESLGLDVTIEAPSQDWSLSVDDHGAIAAGTGDTHLDWNGKVGEEALPTGDYTLRLASNGKAIARSVHIERPSTEPDFTVSIDGKPAQDQIVESEVPSIKISLVGSSGDYDGVNSVKLTFSERSDGVHPEFRTNPETFSYSQQENAVIYRVPFDDGTILYPGDQFVDIDVTNKIGKSKHQRISFAVGGRTLFSGLPPVTTAYKLMATGTDPTAYKPKAVVDYEAQGYRVIRTDARTFNRGQYNLRAAPAGNAAVFIVIVGTAVYHFYYDGTYTSLKNYLTRGHDEVDTSAAG